MEIKPINKIILLVRRPPLWSSGQSSWLQIQRSGFDSRRYHIFWGIVGLERGPLYLVSTIEELLGRNSSGSGLKNREYGRADPLRWPRYTFYPQKLALTSPTCGGRSVGIVRLRTKITALPVHHTRYPNTRIRPNHKFTTDTYRANRSGACSFVR
jgi:hypothetical protein